ncbi:MAG: MraY family glycosyltransferase [Candidatus Saccharimonadales bacterium]
MVSLDHLIVFSVAFAVSFLAIPLVKKLAIRIEAMDVPDSRKIHSKPLPRIGGLAIFLGFIIPFLIYFDLDRRLWGFLIALLIVFLVGFVEDVRGLGVWQKLSWQAIAAVAVLAGGIGIVAVTNPVAGGFIFLDSWRIPVEVLGLGFNIIPLANLVSVIWIVGIINTVNFLDGMDGLASGISIIAALVLFAISLTPAVDNSNLALLTMMLSGSLLGFLLYNWHPSSIFMGDSGAFTIGLILAVITIYSGSKIAVGVLVLGVAIFDAVWAVTRRLYNRQSPFAPDRGHIHHQLLDSGLSQTQVVMHLYIVAGIIGATAVFYGGITAFTVLLIMIVLTVSIARIRVGKIS